MRLVAGGGPEVSKKEPPKFSQEFPDKTGLPLQPGDLIVYGHALGRCAGLQYGRVIGIVPPTEEKPSRLKVQGIELDDNRDHDHPGEERPWKGYEKAQILKPSTLYFPSRVLRITAAQVPPKVLALLEKLRV